MKRSAQIAGTALLLGTFVVTTPQGATAAEQTCAPAANKSVVGTPWAQQRLAPQQAWTLTRGKGELVAVVGTGVSATTPALAGAVLAGYDVRNGRSANQDCTGQSTFVAGLLAARPQSRTGLAGVAPAARIYPVRVTDDQDQVEPALLAKGIRAAVDAKAKVVAVAVSTGSVTGALRSAVRYAASHDVVLVASTDSVRSSSAGSTDASYPAALPGVLAVVSTTTEGAASTSAGSTRPTLAAPGENLLSVAPHGAGQVTGGGSAVAVGFVAGAAALVRDYRPDLDARQVITRLEATADHPSGTLPDGVLGYGTVDPGSAVATDLPDEENYRAEALIPARLNVPPATSADTRPRTVALLASGVALGLTALAAVVFSLVREGRRRKRRPASSPRPIG